MERHFPRSCFKTKLPRRLSFYYESVSFAIMCFSVFTAFFCCIITQTHMSLLSKNAVSVLLIHQRMVESVRLLGVPCKWEPALFGIWFGLATGVCQRHGLLGDRQLGSRARTTPWMRSKLTASHVKTIQAEFRQIESHHRNKQHQQFAKTHRAAKEWEHLQLT